MAQRTALLAGATGLVGSRVLRLLLESPHYSRVTILTRRWVELDHPRLEQLVVDFQSLPPFGSPDDVFCALGSTIKKAGSQTAFREIDHDYPLAVARQAVEAGAKQFVLVSSVGADRRSGNFYLRVKGELEDALAALPFRSLHVFQPSFLMGERAEARTGERLGIVAAKMLGPLLVGGLRKFRAVPAEAVARAMVESAVRAEPGRHVYTYEGIVPFIG
jgi:uncharacterized protein YbjT (DUF2867 family)